MRRRLGYEGSDSTTDIDATDDRLRILLAQLDGAWEMLDARLAGRRPQREESGESTDSLTDAEYFWEPVPGCWSLRRRGEAVGPRPVGKGDWLLDSGSPEPQPPPFTTVAWRMCHIAMWERMRYDYTFGSHSLTLDEFIWPSTVHEALALKPGDRLLFEVRDDDPNQVHVRRLRASYAGVLAGIYGSPEEVAMYLRREHEAWMD